MPRKHEKMATNFQSENHTTHAARPHADDATTLWLYGFMNHKPINSSATPKPEIRHHKPFTARAGNDRQKTDGRATGRKIAPTCDFGRLADHDPGLPTPYPPLKVLSEGPGRAHSARSCENFASRFFGPHPAGKVTPTNLPCQGDRAQPKKGTK